MLEVIVGILCFIILFGIMINEHFYDKRFRRESDGIYRQFF